MEDPLSAVHDRPHRYLLESDSSDEEGQGLYGSNDSGPSKLKPTSTPVLSVQDIEINDNGPWDTCDEILLGVGQAGRYLVKTLGGGQKADVEIRAGDSPLGSGWMVGKRLVLSMDDGGLDSSLHAVAQALVNKAGNKPWYVTCH